MQTLVANSPKPTAWFRELPFTLPVIIFRRLVSCCAPVISHRGSNFLPQTRVCGKKSLSFAHMAYVCYGFEVMATHESLRHPFQIFRSRFTVAPKLIIIYDNACKLHQYCLDREPCSFLRPHTICCRSLPLAQPYRLLIRLRTINSLVNEQANDGLQHIKGQL